MKKSVFGLLVTTRGFFNPILAKEGRKAWITKLKKMGYEYVALSEEDTKFGTVETVDDAKKCARLFYANKDRINGIIVSAPNFGDEVGTVNAIDMAKLDVPVLVQACDDDTGKMDLANRRDAFCGKLSICNNLNQYNIKFTNTTLHSCRIESEQLTKDVEYFDRVCQVVSGLRKARIAQIGTRPGPFQTIRFSEKLLQKAGITVVPVDLSEIMFSAMKLDDNADVKKKIEEIKAYGKIPSGIKEESIVKSAKLSLAVEKFMNDNDCQAGAMICWTSIQENYGCAACLPMSLQGEKGKPMACETDITGAVAMYALYLASGEPAGYLDWNNNYNDDRNKCIVIHCSNHPKSFIGREFEISTLDVLGNALGYDKCFGACKAKQIAAGKMTFAKVSTDDVNGKVKAYVGEGEFTDDPIDTAGDPGVCQVNDLQGLMNYLCMNGFEHHVAMNRSSSAKVLEEAFGKYLGWDVYRHE
jgi:L-fucose isomerase-like protein